VWFRGHHQWHDLHAEFHQNLPFGSKVFRETQMDRHTDHRQNDDLTSLTFIL
jgi:hypothetical protein